jgi:ABC-type uncharacterized transport system involved in gliding motility auxiliary subunit
MSERLSGWLGWLGITLVVGAFLVRFTMPAQQEVWWWSAVAGIVVISLYTLTQWRDIVESFSRRQTRYGALATSSIVLALGILVALNFVLVRQNRRWDLTAGSQYSLSPQTVRILESLKTPIHIIAFGRDVEFPAYRDRLTEYEYQSSQVSLEFVDVDKEPLRAGQYNVQSYGTVVFEYEDRIERVVSLEEQALTNGLIKVVEGEELRVSFIQGHAERAPDGTERDDYGGLGEALQRDNLIVDTVVLAQTGEVPTSTSVVVVAGPTTDYLPGEIAVLRTYLEQGGKALFLIDPADNPATTTPQPNLIALIAEWGIELGNDVVVDVSGVGQLLGTDATVPVAATYPPHPITNNFELLTAFPLARSVSPASNGAGDRVAQAFVQTSARSWAETDLTELKAGEIQMDDDDIPGPITIGAAVAVKIEIDKPETPNSSTKNTAASNPVEDTDVEEQDDDPTTREARVAVIGDSDFAANGSLGIQGNRDLALNTINWLAEQENLIAIRPRQPEDRRITLTADQQLRITWLSLFMIPTAVIGIGLFTWWRRR